VKKTTLAVVSGLIVSLALLVAADEDRADWRVTGTRLASEITTESSLRGLAVSAPHDGFDGYTGLLLRLVGKEYEGLGRVAAFGYRSRSLKRYINVNRPTEERYRFGSFAEDESETPRAWAVFAEYRARLLAAARVERHLELLVELHGHSRKVKIGGRKRHLDVIEVASTGLSRERLEALDEIYRRESRGLGLPKLYFEGIPSHQHYDFAGAKQRFHYRASGAKKSGSLSPAVTSRALHFELPRPVRYDPALRRKFLPILIKLIKKAWQDTREEMSSTPGIVGRLRSGD